MEYNKKYCFRVISNQVRFGCGYKAVDARPVILEGWNKLL